MDLDQKNDSDARGSNGQQGAAGKGKKNEARPGVLESRGGNRLGPKINLLLQKKKNLILGEKRNPLNGRK